MGKSLGFIVSGLFVAVKCFAGLNLMPVDSCQSPLPDSAAYEDLKAKIETCKIQTIEALIPVLSDAHRSHYVLMHHSQSLQESSFESPRAILFGRDAKLILAFNGDPKQFHNAQLEVLQFREATQKFEAREISFTGKTVFSQANPQMCLSCHHDDPRPNFESYPLWPGAYGGEDDDYFRDPQTAAQKTQDGKAFQKFLSHAKKKGRYRFLSDLPKDALPNTEFGSLLQGLNQERIARKIAEFTKLKPFRYALVGAATCFYSGVAIDEFLPKTVSVNFKKSLLDLKLETAKLNADEFLSRIEQLKQIYTKVPETDRVEEILESIQSSNVGPGQVSDQRVANLRYLVENMGMSTEDWSLQPNSKVFDFENGYVGIHEIRKPLARTLLNDPSDQAIVKNIEDDALSELDLQSVCMELKQKSLVLLQNTFNASKL